MALLILKTYHQAEVNGQHHAPVALLLGAIPYYLLNRRLFRPQKRSGYFGNEKSLDIAGSRTFGCPPVV